MKASSAMHASTNLASAAAAGPVKHEGQAQAQMGVPAQHTAGEGGVRRPGTPRVVCRRQHDPGPSVCLQAGACVV
eukprot:scaffold127147_cov27-Tisochrysis_lutea.AAC.2